MARKYAPHFFDKVAGPKMDAFKEVVTHPGFLAPIALAGIGAGIGGLQRVIGNAVEARAKAKSYKDMIAMHPHFKGRKETEVRGVYTSLYAMNPHMARDPRVAGAMVDHVIERQGFLGGSEATSNQALLETAKELAGIRNAMAGAQKSEQQIAQARQVDFKPILEAAGRSYQDTMRSVNEQHGQVGVLKEKIREISAKRDETTRKHVEQEFQARTGLPLNRDSIMAVHQANQMAENPAIAQALSELRNHSSSRLQKRLDQSGKPHARPFNERHRPSSSPSEDNPAPRTYHNPFQSPSAIKGNLGHLANQSKRNQSTP